MDTPPDFSTRDFSTRDTSTRDTSTRDTSTRDTSTRDTSTRDTSTRDTSTRDTAAHPAPTGADPTAQASLRRIRLLVGAYLGISLAAMVAIVLLRDDPAEVTDAVWVRAGIVLISAALTLSFAVHAARGSRRSYLRLRLVTALMLVAVVVIVALPGAFPVWLRLEQAACGLCLLGVVLLANGPTLRTAFAGGR